MKEYRLIIMGLIITALSLASCSDNSADSAIETQAPVTGKWYYSQQGLTSAGDDFLQDYTMHTPGCSKDNIVLGEDNSYTHNEYEEGNCGVSSTTSTYTLDDNVLTLGTGPDAETYEIESVTATSLRLRQAETVNGVTEYWVETFTRD